MTGRDVGSIVAHLILDRRQFTDGLEKAKAEAKAFEDSAATARVDADTGRFDAKMVAVREAKRKTAEAVSVAVEADLTAFYEDASLVEAAKRALGKGVEIPVGFRLQEPLVNLVKSVLQEGADPFGLSSLGLSAAEVTAGLHQVLAAADAQAQKAMGEYGARMARAMVAGWMSETTRMLGPGSAASGVYNLLALPFERLGSGSGAIPLGPSTPNWELLTGQRALGAGPQPAGSAGYTYRLIADMLGAGSGSGSPLDSGGAYSPTRLILDAMAGSAASGASGTSGDGWTLLTDQLALGVGAASDLGGSESGGSGSSSGSMWSSAWAALFSRLHGGGSGGSASAADGQWMSAAAYQLHHLRNMLGDAGAAEKAFGLRFGSDAYKAAADELKRLGIDASKEGDKAGSGWGKAFAKATAKTLKDAWKGSGSSGGGGGGGGMPALPVLLGGAAALMSPAGAGTLLGGLISLGGTSLVGAGAGLGMLYDMYSTISSVTKASTTARLGGLAYQQAVATYGAGSTQAASALSTWQTDQLALAAAKQNANPAALPVAASFSNLAALLGPVIDKAEVPMYAGLASIVAGLQSQSGGVGSIFKASGSTFGAFFNNIGTDLKSPIFSGIVKNIAGAIPTDLGGLLDGMLHFTEGFGKIVETFQPAAEALAKGFDSLGNSFANWTLGLKMPKGGVSAMMGLLDTLGGAVSNLASALGPLGSALAPLGGPTEAILLGLTKGIADLVKAAAPGLGTLATDLGPLLKSVAKWLPSLGTAAGKSLGHFFKDVGNLVKNAPQWYKDATKLPLIGDMFKKLGSDLSAIATPLAGGGLALGILGLFKPFRKLEMVLGKLLLTSAVDMFKALGTIAWAGISAGIRAVATSMGIMELSEGWVGLIAAGIAALAVGGYLLVTHWTAVVNFLRGPWGSVIMGVGIGIAGLVLGPIGLLIGAAALIALHWKSFSAFFKTVWHDVEGFFVAAWGVISRNVVTPLSDGASGLMTAWGAIERFFKHLWGKVESVFRTAAGVVVGIIATITAPISAAIGLFNSLTSLIGGGSGGVNNVFGLNGNTVSATQNLPSMAGLHGVNFAQLAAGLSPSNVYQSYPGAASGGSFGAGDIAWTGEQGPELVQFHRAATVIPHAASIRAASAAGPSAANVTFAPSYGPISLGAGADLGTFRAVLEAHDRKMLATLQQMQGH